MPSFFPDAPRTSGRWNSSSWLSAWLPAIIGIAVICIESTGTFSAQNTSSWLRPIFEHLFGRFQDASWELFHHYLRKSGHFLGYGSLGLAFLRAWLYTLNRNRSLHAWRLRATALAIASTALVASGDEFHQTFLPGRTGVPSDVVLDTLGAGALCLLVWLVRFRVAPRSIEPLPSDA
ncbi:MAG TPA: VanZ family protein [Acidobacteriaceae bacterium]